MTNKDYFQISLPKWPALLVVGKPVTKEQAMEIIIRTDSFSFSTNDESFKQALCKYFYDVNFTERYQSLYDAVRTKLGLTEKDWNKISEYIDEKNKELGLINLNYLDNHRIVSSWIGGPHGWCDWSGTIYSNNYNIGKWPSVEEVYKEWKAIAKEFPFLDLKCQLMGHESGYPEGETNQPVIEFTVKNGKVKMSIPKAALDITDNGLGENFYNIFREGGERGCTFEKFVEAVEFVKNKMKNK